MTKDTNNPTTRNNVWKYEEKISALKNYVQRELFTLHNKTDPFMETFNKTISNFETKPYEILQGNIEFFQNELRSKDEIIKTLMETQTVVLENLPLSKPPQQTENNTSFHDSPQKDVNQLNQNIIVKRQANQEYNKQPQILNIKKSVKNRTVTVIKNLNKKKDINKDIIHIGNIIRILKNKTLSSFLALMQLHTCRKIIVSNYRLEKMGKIKALALQ